MAVTLNFQRETCLTGKQTSSMTSLDGGIVDDAAEIYDFVQVTILTSRF